MQNITIINSDCSHEQPKIPKITYIIEPTGVKFEEAKRVIAIVYLYDDDNNIKYGASIFRKVSKTDICVKSKIRETAIDRFNKNPVCFTLSNISDINNKLKYDDIIKQIRYKMYKYGVKGKDVIYDNLIQNYDLSVGSNNVIEKESNYLDNYFTPRITYILEPKGSTWQNAKRIIAIVYSYTNNKISYGASIFKRDYEIEACTKASIRSTAFERFYNYPICLEKNNYNDDNKISVVKVLDIIRKQMHTLGVGVRQY